jgi:hypothetical protein
MACRVVQAQTLGGVLFNQEVATVFFNNGRHRDTGAPTRVHILGSKTSFQKNIDLYFIPFEVKIYQAQ